MNNPAMNGQPQRPINTTLLIKPEQVLKIPFTDNNARMLAHQTVQGLWHTITNTPQNSPQFVQAYDDLHKYSQGVRVRMQAQKANNANNANNARAASVGQGQPAVPAQQTLQRPQGQPGQPPQHFPLGMANNNGQQTGQQYSEKVLQKVREYEVAVPQRVQQQGPNAVQEFMARARKTYASALQGFESNSQNLDRMDRFIATKRSENGGRLADDQEQNYRDKRGQVQLLREQARTSAQNFLQGQVRIKQENDRMQMAEESVRRNQGQNGGVVATTQGPSGQAYTVNSALEAARTSEANEQGRTTTESDQKGPTPVNQSDSQGPTQHSPKQSQPTRETKPGETAPNQRPLPTTNQAGTHQQPPVPLSHEAAMQQARSYPNQNPNPQYQQSTTQNPPHTHPTQQQKPVTSNESGVPSHAKMNIPKDLNIPPPQPVAMPPARPTLTGGPFPSGPIGAPAIQRHPGYVLEGDGERVLSKKKLEELVRQVSGSTGEGDDGETMSPEVEEVRRTSQILLARQV